MTKVLNWGMTPGMGDAMLALNCAHRWSFNNDAELVLNLHWLHGKDHLHHPEDPETIIERVDYIRGLYLKAKVEVNHVFNTDRTDLMDTYTRYDWLSPRANKKTNSWLFDPSTRLPRDTNKIVVWRPLFNAETPKYWKRIVTNCEWNDIIDSYKDSGYSVIELCYRTPIREVTYHINTCNFILCYDGMWHYIARNFNTPMLVASFNEITRVHTRHAITADREDFVRWSKNMHMLVHIKEKQIAQSPYDFMQTRAKQYEKDFWRRYSENR